MFETEIINRINNFGQIWKLRQDFCEIEHDMLYLGNMYEAASVVVPYEFTIVDLGCYMAAQAFLFSRHKRYVGVDEFDNESASIAGYTPPERFTTYNCEHITDSIEHYLKNCGIEDKKKAFAIMNAVPDPTGELKKLVLATFPNAVIKYPREEGIGQGACSNDTLRLCRIMEQAECPYTKNYLRQNLEEAEKYDALREKVEKEILRFQRK